MTAVTDMTVIHTGPLSLLVDEGRKNLAHTGLTSGAAMDQSAYDWANRLCGNAGSHACIETLGGLVVRFDGDACVAVTGAQARMTLNQVSVNRYASFNVARGDVLEIGMPDKGMRLYLAVSGGFKMPVQLGSRTTVSREKLGGLDGQGGVLRHSDVIPLVSSPDRVHRALERSEWPDFAAPLVLRVVEGYQASSMSSLQKRRFYSGRFITTANMDRMGMRLSGPTIETGITHLTSEGITLGAVQIPTDGQPIVMMSDRQTIGGYPKIGSVLSIDCDKLAQAPVGTEIDFQCISIEQAHGIMTLARIRRDNLDLIVSK